MNRRIGLGSLSLLLALAVVFACANICFGSEAALEKAWTYYLRGDYHKALDTCRKIPADRAASEQKYYIMGLSFLKLGQPKEARKNFEFVLKNYPASGRIEELLLGMADSYYLEENWQEAEQYYLRLLRTFPDTGYGSMSYLRLGISQRRQGKWQEAESSFYKVERDFPLSLEAGEARDYLKKKTAYFSVQVGAFSKSDNAQRLCGVLRKKGYDAYVEKTYKGDELIYRVKIGRFDTEKGAQGEADRLKREGFKVKICS